MTKKQFDELMAKLDRIEELVKPKPRARRKEGEK